MNESTLCAHCHLPVRKDVQQREVNGESFRFCCYGCCLAFQVGRGRGEESEAAWLLIRLGIGIFLTMFIMLFSLLLYSGTFGAQEGELVTIIHYLLWTLATPVVIILGGPFLHGAWEAALKARANADTLVSIGVIGAYSYSALQTVGGGKAVYFDTATMVLVLFTVGRFVEAGGRARTARSLAPMLSAERAMATVVSAGRDSELSIGKVRPGMMVRVRPGERMPVDGYVLEGHSHCDEAILTGQHEPQVKEIGSNVCAGSINGTGQLLVETTVAGADTRWGQIGKFVSDALQVKSLSGEIVDRVAAVFVPAVIVLAGASVAYWSRTQNFEDALMTGLAVLVVACPCALGLAAPLATALGLGQAAQNGVLVRGGGVLERLAGVKAIAFDKTGTLTTGNLQLQRLHATRVSERELLARASGLAQGSEHPIARGIAATARSRAVEPLQIQNIQALPGQGVLGELDGDDCAMGSVSLMQSLNWPIPQRLTAQATAMSECSLVYIAWDRQVQGLLGLADNTAKGARLVIDSLIASGLTVCLLSGDNAAAVASTARAAGIKSWRADLSPQGKVEALREWASHHRSVAMVGDGLNDGPVLATASVGIAVGGATDLARETADIALPEGTLERLPWLIALARRVRRTIYSNIAWALAYNAVALTLAATGMLAPIVAAALMAGSSLVVAFNSLRLSREAAPATPDLEARASVPESYPQALGP